MSAEQILASIDPVDMGRRLGEARRRNSQLTQQAVADALNVARTTMVAVEKGQRRVTPEELIKLVELYEVDLSTLLKPDSGDVNLAVQFRTLIEQSLFDTRKDALDEAIKLLQKYAVQYVELEQILGKRTSPRFGRQWNLKGVSDIDGYAEDAAQEERRRLNLGDGPIPNLQEVLEENVGLRIFRIPMDAKIDGFYGYAAQLGGCIAINAKHPSARQDMTVAHEYGHVTSDPENVDIQVVRSNKVNTRAERFARLFSMNFLMTASGVRRQLREYFQHRGDMEPTVGDLVYLAQKHHVSTEAYILRLEQLGHLPRGYHRQLKAEDFSPKDIQQEMGTYVEDDARGKRRLGLAEVMGDHGQDGPQTQ
ncbi:Zn-dependent peptidase ImmA (M78 family)/DNA-binding XRE family transcriptional regulator [Deinococcus budaensis]|uniref:Zn-dependent peptidase ImmA (M78 family)/DNA-binding XRE family transcriptional regulator n=1 Tax=Deinococcus budaensis TaxID=1665626 RepID=A0A7W8LS48_9DEIO|nr:Zn-dependent peptidase ImmA (M78 family)/DNA-binding XRE family transcriptional regulator [Deinococcus budaensis]